MGNLTLAWRNARKGKTSIPEVMAFDENVERNLISLHKELVSKTYKPRPLSTFVLRDPKTRVISKSDFRDRVVHHALIRVIGNIFELTFIYDSCANQKNKGTSLAINRFRTFQCKATLNYSKPAFCLKADIKQYFPNIDHSILLNILKRKIKDEDVIWLIEQIISNKDMPSVLGERAKCLPLGNLTSQFFANVYLNELDQFVKHKLKVKYYIRYVDDFIIFHSSKKQLIKWKNEIEIFLKEVLKLDLHPQKSRIIPLIRGVDFVGFRNFCKYAILRKRNIRNMQKKINSYERGDNSFSSVFNSYQGWQAYAKWANTTSLRKRVKSRIINALWNKL